MIAGIRGALVFFWDLLRHCGWDLRHLFTHLIELFITFRKVALI